MKLRRYRSKVLKVKFEKCVGCKVEEELKVSK